MLIINISQALKSPGLLAELLQILQIFWPWKICALFNWFDEDSQNAQCCPLLHMLESWPWLNNPAPWTVLEAILGQESWKPRRGGGPT